LPATKKISQKCKFIFSSFQGNSDYFSILNEYICFFALCSCTVEEEAVANYGSRPIFERREKRREIYDRCLLQRLSLFSPLSS